MIIPVKDEKERNSTYLMCRSPMKGEDICGYADCGLDSAKSVDQLLCVGLTRGKRPIYHQIFVRSSSLNHATTVAFVIIIMFVILSTAVEIPRGNSSCVGRRRAKKKRNCERISDWRRFRVHLFFSLVQDDVDNSK